MKNTITLLEQKFLETNLFIDKSETNFFLFLFKQSSSQLSKLSKNFLHEKIVSNNINLTSNNELNNIDRKTSSLFQESLASFDMLSNIDLYHHLKNELNQNISQKNIIKI